MTILTAAAEYCAIKHVHLEIALREYFRRSNKKYCVPALFHYGITTLNDAIDKMIIFRVKDNGAGIDPEILRRLFTKFSSKLETGGTVLDLFISKAIIESYGDRYGLRIMQMAQELLIL